MSEDQTIKNGLIINENGTKCWYKDNKLHRDDNLPAIEYNNGKKEWYQNGKLHRDNDLPAAEWSNGEQWFYQNGQLHRENGLPAIIHPDGIKEYWEYGKGITQEEGLRRKEVRELKQKLTNTLPESSMKSTLNKI